MRRSKRDTSERMCDSFSFRISPTQRKILEKLADDQKIGLCEAMRVLFDAGAEARGLTA